MYINGLLFKSNLLYRKRLHLLRKKIIERLDISLPHRYVFEQKLFNNQKIYDVLFVICLLWDFLKNFSRIDIVFKLVRNLITFAYCGKISRYMQHRVQLIFFAFLCILYDFERRSFLQPSAL